MTQALCHLLQREVPVVDDDDDVVVVVANQSQCHSSSTSFEPHGLAHSFSDDSMDHGPLEIYEEGQLLCQPETLHGGLGFDASP
jgi:hypothetical protein